MPLESWSDFEFFMVRLPRSTKVGVLAVDQIEEFYRGLSVFV